tara:strand:- start:1435 stop:1635 length:201 start_codon:yes stop_codon:yes gene_type:complete
VKIGDLVKCADPHIDEHGSVGLIMDHEVYYNMEEPHGVEGWWVAYIGGCDWRWQSAEDLEVISASG